MDLTPCPFCEFDIHHRHPDGRPPIAPCRSCYVGVHDMCDGTTYWCGCPLLACVERYIQGGHGNVE